MGVMPPAYRGRSPPPPQRSPPRCDNTHSSGRADPLNPRRNHYKRGWGSDIQGATLGSAATPATGGLRQISPMTPSAPGTSLTGRAFGPT